MKSGPCVERTKIHIRCVGEVYIFEVFDKIRKWGELARFYLVNLGEVLRCPWRSR